MFALAFNLIFEQSNWRIFSHFCFRDHFSQTDFSPNWHFVFFLKQCLEIYFTFLSSLPPSKLLLNFLRKKIEGIIKIKKTPSPCSRLTSKLTQRATYLPHAHPKSHFHCNDTRNFFVQDFIFSSRTSFFFSILFFVKILDQESYFFCGNHYLANILHVFFQKRC